MNDPLLNVLTREGVLLNVSVRYWRGQKKLRPEDVGLSPGKVSDRLISLGHKRLLPRDATKSLSLIESRAHALVEANTFPFLNGLGHFLPNAKLAEVTEKLDELQTQFRTAQQRFLDQYQELRSDAVQEWWRMAAELVPDPERLVATIEAAFPINGHMDRYYGFDVRLFQIALPETVSLQLVAAGDQSEVLAARQRAAREAARRIRQDAESFVGDCVASLRQQTAQLCGEMLESIRTSDTGVHQKTLNRLVRFVDQFKQLNFANDTEMEAQLERVRSELLNRSAAEYRDDRLAEQQLTEGLARLRDHARELAQQDAAELVNRFGNLGHRKFHLAA
jgi:hypothetical protein